MITATTNVAEFNRVLNMVAEASSRTYPEVCNGQGMALSSRSLRATKRTDPGKIATQLGQVATAIRINKRGKLVKTRVYDKERSTLAYRIVAKRFQESGQPFTEAELDSAVKRFRAARIRSAGFIRAGWIAAIKTLSRVVGYKDARGQRVSAGEAARITGQPKGFAYPAIRKFNDLVTCTVANTALIEDGTNPMPVAEAGLNYAFGESDRDMLQHLYDKMQPVLKKYSGK